MLKFRFAHRVKVYCGYAVYYKASAAAAHLLDSGLASVRKQTGGAITEMELSKLAIGWQQGQVAADQLGLQPGSFGIRVEIFASGTFCFAHRNPWHQVVG